MSAIVEEAVVLGMSGADIKEIILASQVSNLRHNISVAKSRLAMLEGDDVDLGFEYDHLDDDEYDAEASRQATELRSQIADWQYRKSVLEGRINNN